MSTTTESVPPTTTNGHNSANLTPTGTHAATTPSPTRRTSIASLNLRDTLDRQGYVHIPSLIKAPQLTALRAASQHATDLARNGQWPFIRTLPKQFPPWKAEDVGNGIWGVQHLLHPSMPGGEVFAESYFGDAIVECVLEILGGDGSNSSHGQEGQIGDGEVETRKGEDTLLIMELYNLLVRPDHDFALRWHRDDIPPTATAEEESARLSTPSFHTQWNLALYDDNSLIVVPGSHTRPRTETERTADPFTKFMPNQETVHMKAGDVVFYDNNILHRGVYDCNVERMTLHGSMGHVRGSRGRARNVLQHGVGAWVGDVGFEGLKDERTRRRAEAMRERLVQMGEESGEVGFAHPD